MMRRLLLGALVLALFGPQLGAQDDKKKPATPSEEFKSLVEEFQRLRKETGTTFREAKTDAEKKKIFEGYQAKVGAVAGRLLGLAQAHPGDAAAVEALMMVMGIGTDADKDKAVALLRTAVEKGGKTPASAHAAYALGEHLKQQLDEPGLKPDAAAKLSKEVEDLFERATTQLKDATDAKSKQILAMADKQLFALRNLVIGKVAPEIEGVDADGKKFKLSDYRGKVVVLDFWASWCGPCMAMVPHERELVKRLEGKPFALIGVNLDSSRELLKKTEEQHKMSWRSFFDGAQGPISDKWNIQSIPAIYVLDHKGVIRYKDVREKAMDTAVETLLKDAPPAEKK